MNHLNLFKNFLAFISKVLINITITLHFFTMLGGYSYL